MVRDRGSGGADARRSAGRHACSRRGPARLAPSSPWSIDYDADSCALIRSFGSGESPRPISRCAGSPRMAACRRPSRANRAQRAGSTPSAVPVHRREHDGMKPAPGVSRNGRRHLEAASYSIPGSSACCPSGKPTEARPSGRPPCSAIGLQGDRTAAGARADRLGSACTVLGPRVHAYGWASCEAPMHRAAGSASTS